MLEGVHMDLCMWREERWRERANGWHLVSASPIWVLQCSPILSCWMIKLRDCLSIGILSNSEACAGGMGSKTSFSHSPLNVPICFPVCSKEEYITIFYGCGQALIKCSFAEIHLIGHSGDSELKEEEECCPLPRQFAHVHQDPACLFGSAQPQTLHYQPPMKLLRLNQCKCNPFEHEGFIVWLPFPEWKHQLLVNRENFVIKVLLMTLSNFQRF